MDLEKVKNKLKEDFSEITSTLKGDIKQRNTIHFKPKDSDVTTGDLVGGNKITIDQHIHINQLPEEQLDKLKTEILPSIKQFINKDDVTPHESMQLDPEVSLRIKKSENLQKKHKFNEALNSYLDILTDYASSDKLSRQALFTINNNIGICHLNFGSDQERLDKAKRYFDKAFLLKDDAEEERVHLTLSWYFYEVRDIEESLKHAKRAVELKPDYIKAINMIALIRQDKGNKLKEILSDLYFNEDGHLKKTFNKDHSANVSLGQLYSRNQQYDNAIIYFEKAVEFDRQDFVACALLGNTYLLKALRGNIEIKDININADIDLHFLKKAASSFKTAFKDANKLGLGETIRPFMVNFALSCCLLGQYEDAYEEIKNVIKLGAKDKDFLKYKARMESLSGDFKKAIETYSNIPGYNTSGDVSLILLLEGKYDKAIQNIEKYLQSNETIDDEEKTFQESLLAEAYIRKGELKEAYQTLTKTQKSGRETWRTYVTFGSYYTEIENYERAEYFYIKAIEESENHPHTIFDTVEFYGKTEQFSKIIKLLNDIIEKDLPIKELLKEHLFRQLIKAYFHNQEYTKAIEVSGTAIKAGVKREKIRDLISNSYINLKSYADAHKILYEIYDDNPNKFENVYNLARILSLLGKVEESITYYQEAERLPESSSNCQFYMEYSQIQLLLNDKEKALALAEKAREIDQLNPKSPVHGFYLHMTVRCGEPNQAAEYATTFHGTYPKEKIVRKVQAIKEGEGNKKSLTDEFSRMLEDMRERFEFGINNYKSTPLPLSYLQFWFNRDLNEIYLWRIIYNIPIYIDSGNPNYQKTEIDLINKENSLLIDCFAFLILQNIGLVEETIKSFDHVYVPQSVFQDVQNSLINREDDNIRELWNILRTNRKICFCSIEKHHGTRKKEVQKVLGESTFDCLQITEEQNYLYCVGDERLKRFANNEGLRVTGIHAVLNRIHSLGFIDSRKLANAKLKLIKENHTFISINMKDLLSITEDNNYKINDEVKIFFNSLFDGKPNILSYVKVFIDSIVHLLSINIGAKIIAEWIELYIHTFERLYIRDYIAEKFPEYTNKRRIETHKNTEWNEMLFSMLAITDLYAIVELSIKDQEKKKELLQTISRSITHHDLLSMYYGLILTSAKKKAEFNRNKIKISPPELAPTDKW